MTQIYFDPTSPMHSSCHRGDCYEALLRSVTPFEIKQELRCSRCSYNSQKSQKHCVLRVEPSGDAENSSRTSFTAADMNFNRYADGLGVAATPQCVRVAGRDMERIAVMHHQGHTPESGHYTTTVAPDKDLAYFCNGWRSSSAAPAVMVKRLSDISAQNQP